MKLHVLCPQLWIDAQQSITITAPAFSAMGVPTVTRAVPAAHQPHPQGPAGTCRLRASTGTRARWCCRLRTPPQAERPGWLQVPQSLAQSLVPCYHGGQW